jgi:hypothetical protein
MDWGGARESSIHGQAEDWRIGAGRLALDCASHKE